MRQLDPLNMHIPHAQVQAAIDAAWLKVEERYADVLAAARARWPEMPERVAISETTKTWVEIYGKDAIDAPGWWEIVELESVGDYLLGYGPKSHILYVGQKGE